MKMPDAIPMKLTRSPRQGSLRFKFATLCAVLLTVAVPVSQADADPTTIIDVADVTVSGSHWEIVGDTLYTTTYSNTASGNIYDTTWTATNALIVADVGDARLTIAGDGTIATTGRVSVGERAGVAGTLVIESGGVWNFTGDTSQAINTVTKIENSSITTGSATNYMAFEIGSRGEGVMHIAAGGTVSGSGQISLGVHVGATGTILVDGYLKTTNDLQLGGYYPTGGPAGGNGTVIVNSSGTLIAGNIRVAYGNSLASTGTLIVNSGGYGQGAYLIVGHWGNGYFHLDRSGTFRSNSYFAFGQGDDSANRLGGVGYGLIEGHAIAGSYFNVGGNGLGLVHIARTATVDIGTYSNVGNGATSSGSLVIDGNYNVGTTMYVGSTGTGYLHVTNSGTLKVGDRFASGNGLGSQGTVIIDGYVSTGIFSIGYTRQTAANTVAATGVLYLNSTGTIISKEVGIGYLGAGSGASIANTTGTAWVDGYWHATGNFGVGRSGDGVLHLSSSGTIINTGNGNIGAYYSSGHANGIAYVDGYWQTGALFQIGAAGNGQLQLSTSGTIIAGTDINIASGANSTSSAVIEGYLSGGGKFVVGTSGRAYVDLKSSSDVTANGDYMQNNKSTLAVELLNTRKRDTIDPSLAAPIISVGGAATLSGTLYAYGAALLDVPEFEFNADGYAKASTLTGIPILRASGGLTGDFDRVEMPDLPIPSTLPDFIRGGGLKVNEGGALDTRYDVGYGVAWRSGVDSAHGTFTIDDGYTFEVDIQLADRPNIPFSTGWDGHSLIKRGDGSLILSVENTYTGTTTVDGGRLIYDGPQTHSMGALVNNSIVDFGGTGDRSLVATSLAGSGTYLMKFNLNAGTSDYLNITGDASGSHHLDIVAVTTGERPTGDEGNITLLSIGGVDRTSFTADITLNGQRVHGGFDYGVFQYSIEMQGHELLIKNVGLQADVRDTIKGIPGAQSLMWFDQIDNVTRRFGELRVPLEGELGLDFWARGHASSSEIGGGTTEARLSDVDLWGAEIGADYTWLLDGERATVGAYVGVGGASQDFAGGSSEGDSDLLGLGIYGAWITDSGWFLNATLSMAQYDNQFEANRAGPAGYTISGDYKDRAFGVTVELGHRFNIKNDWFIEPAVQGALVRQTRGSCHTDTFIRDGEFEALRLHGADATINRFRGAIRFGRAWQLSNGSWLEIAARGAAIRERSTGGEINIGSADEDRWRPNLDGERFEAGVGVYWQPCKKGQLYFDYEYATGDNFNKPWAISLGFRFSL
ncbi:outer membrane autotransporter protein [Ereboglobus sp. PH5-5]|uniref:autotransporter outer membrane beta-barrel domain-containing protein n=1 Tax=Ereboglobus sp. PH5-5 TaxID=2940529 RepID=UPI00240723B7|nr:autotransporter outer membrane beta-barrel domain-containing protein [Ereboglobus sp. PH5-5]MDF9832162.1 outer membrane autotransporter protein [Ereboglobus sp. PH5-5]